jgi:hypothetical protein
LGRALFTRFEAERLPATLTPGEVGVYRNVESSI